MKRYGDSKGFTLVEILIALALMSIITTAIYQLYISQYKTWISQDLVTEMQQNARFSIDLMTREMQLAGYDIPSGETAIKEATDTKFTFWSRDLSISGAANVQRRKVSFYQDGANLKMDVVTEAGGADTGNVVAENVESLDFDYYDDQNNQITNLPADMGLIRRVKVTLKVRTSRKDPITLDYKRMTLITELRPRNLGIGEVVTDITPPAVPTGLEAVDPGRCGTLRLRWNANTEVDLSGYTIYYGQQPGSYTGKVSVSKSAYSGYDLAGLTVSPSNANGTSIPYVTYYIAIAAFDTSGNISGYSTEVYGNPATSARAFGGPNDTTINIEKPTALPASFIGVAVDGSGNPLPDGQVRLTWTPSTDPNVIGYRIYRKTDDSDFSAFPIVADGSTIAQVANESTLTSAANSFTDTGPGLIGCKVYYYAIAPVTCDATLITDDAGDDNSKRYTSSDYARTYGDGAGSAADSPADSDTAPGDNVPPGSPTVAARAGWRRVAISVTNPTDSDFGKTCLYVEKGGAEGAPTLDITKDANGCFNVVNASVGTRGLIPDASPDTNPNGIFTNTSPVSFWHDSMTERTPASPDLAQAGQEIQTYAYKAVTFDRCGNPKTPAEATSATAVATTNLCGEDPQSGEKPPAPGLPGTTKSGCGSPATIHWTPVSSDVSQPSSVTNPWDLAGYRILRSNTTDFSAATLLTTPAPYWCEGSCSYQDSSVLEGEAYYYKVASTDCPYEKENPSDATVRADINVGVIHSAAVIGPVRPGMLDRRDETDKQILTRDFRGALGAASTEADPKSSATAGYHNVVKMYFRNTSAGTMTITGIANLSWNKDTAKLAKVTIGGENSAPAVPLDAEPQWKAATAADLKSSAVSNLVFGTAKTITATSQHVPIILEFRDTGGNVSDLADMRGVEVRIQLNVTNDSTGTANCSTYLTETRLDQAIAVSKGPTFDNDVPPDGSDIDDISVKGTSESAGRSPGMISPSGSVTEAVPRVGKNDNIEVYAYIKKQDSAVSGISSFRKIYWKETSTTTTTPPATFPNAVDMSLVAGDQYKGTIPAKKGKRVWFYMVAYDDRDGLDVTTNDRNFDRSPEVTSGYYVYDQVGDPCSDVPDVPSNVSLTNSPSIDVDASGKVNLSWTAPTTNTDDTAIFDLKGYRIYEAISTDKGATWSNYAKVSTDPNTGITFSYVPDEAAGTWYRYCVAAYDTCSTAKENPVYSAGPPIVGVSGTTACLDYRDASDEKKEKVIKGTCANPPGQPTGVSHTFGVGNNTITLNWIPPTDTDKDLKEFWLWEKPSTTEVWTRFAIVPETTTTYTKDISGYASGTVLTYEIGAFDYCDKYNASPYYQVTKP
jgi:prepilin-type N-terminal cleavage/methylation domain-containing protein